MERFEMRLPFPLRLHNRRGLLVYQLVRDHAEARPGEDDHRVLHPRFRAVGDRGLREVVRHYQLRVVLECEAAELR
jgi:hypothetical protein